MLYKMPRPRAKERACEKAIKKTLAYRSQFNYPLSFYQLTTYLISKQKFDYQFFNKILKRLVKNKAVRKRKGKYYLTGVKPVSWEKRVKGAEKTLGENKYVIDTLATIPWIKMIGITGTLGAYNLKKSDDIDIFVVTEKGRLWLSRLFMILLLKVLHKYPSKHGEAGKICPNIIVDEKNMAWPKDRRNIYTATEVALLQPVFQRDTTYLKFMRENEWALNHFGNFKVNFPHKKTPQSKRSELVERLEKWVRNKQMSHMEKKKTTEIVKTGFVHFNLLDSQPSTLQNYKKQLKKLGVEK
jgi:hypothetical protein